MLIQPPDNWGHAWSDKFSRELGLHIWLPLPPPDNQCHRSGQYSRYPTQAYLEWLRVCAPYLSELLGEWQPDTKHWWTVSGYLWLGSRGDAQNYIKPAVDLLSGARVENSRIVKFGALWDDDNRVNIEQWRVIGVRYHEPCLRLYVSKTHFGCVPIDYRALAEQEQREARAAAKAELAAAREQAKLLAKAERAAARAAAKKGRSPG